MTNNLFSVDAEEALLSIILNAPEVALDLNSIFPDMFSSLPSRIIYRMIMELVETDILPTLDLIKVRLKINNLFLEAGEDSYLDYLLLKNKPKVNIKEYETIIVTSYKARKLIEVSSSIPGMVKANSSDIDGIISTVKYNLDKLETSSSKNGVAILATSLKNGFAVIKHRLENPGLSGLTTGFSNIDLLTGGHPKGDVWVIAGRPSMAKSALVLNSVRLTSDITNKAGFKSLFFSLEMTEQGIIDRLLAIDSGVSLRDIRLGIVKDAGVELLSKSFQTLKSNPLYLDTSFHTNASTIVSTTKRYCKNHNIEAVYIDYLQIGIERDSNATHEIGKFTRTLKKLAKDLNIAICVLSQINRGVESRDDKRPVLSDLRQSGNIEEDADLVAFLYRDDYYYKNSTNKDIIEFIVRKHRNGPIGTVFLKFTPETTKIKDL